MDRGPVTAARAFTRVVREKGADQFARLHCIWGLGQIATRSELAVTELTQLLDDKDAEVRAQAAKVLGEANLGQVKRLAALLSDDNARVRFFAAQALSKFGDMETLDADCRHASRQ